MERDPLKCFYIHSQSISTHTLTWSVTLQILEWRMIVLHFNSHAHVERDLWSSHNAFAVFDFNSHAHVERDRCDCCGIIPGQRFQLTRSRGAWRDTHLSPGLFIAFQLTRSRGAWPLDSRLIVAQRVFQLTRSRGAWPRGCTSPYIKISFQLTRSRGAWRGICPTTERELLISTHTLTWSVTVLRTAINLSSVFQLTRSRGAWLNCSWVIQSVRRFQLTRSRGAWR